MATTESPTAREERAVVGDIIEALVDRRRRIASLQAEEAVLLHAAQQHALTQRNAACADNDAPDDITIRSIAAEIGAATRQSDRTIQSRMDEASTLVTRFPATLDALTSGRISRAHAAVIADAGARLTDDDARAAYETAVLPVAERETVGRLRPIARRLAEALHPTPIDERHHDARRQRRVWIHDGDDGMAELGLTGPAPLVHGVYDRLTQLARAVLDAPRPAAADDDTIMATAEPASAKAPDTRRVDQVRVDVALDLLLYGHATAEASSESIAAADAIRARIQVTIPAMSLLGAADAAADLTGYGPIDPDLARQLAGTAAGWDRLFTSPTTGAVLAIDRYRPSRDQLRMLRARDEHCRFPGCRQPLPRCDVDHTVAREHDGPTAVTNLAHLCRRHHTLKHHSAWRVRQRADGTLEWTSPTGRVHDDRPARTLVFEPPPF
ncbi:uncharacterized protein DUF222 [Microbacterium sp. AG790]|uniref:HNH endonuclease signature motif containing protein n=1 Tax=Microbacterium sp. AG790 TaxID=2183995 RepID=UPI000EADE937|nr:HNH endonuclease signature motif containing protein [Microbacterium sp. AG790]RKS93070.1 uncharacterized protein DUF222 [Microbacterium sp. AG790]